jgi:hypothetical protein
MRKVKCYIASPYSNGDKEQNVQLQMDATYHLLKMGFNPYMPLYHHFLQEQDCDFPWLEIDKSWLKDCDIAIRLHPKNESGEEIYSPGADEEEEFCKENGIPMFHYDTLEEMVRCMQTFQNTIE